MCDSGSESEGVSMLDVLNEENRLDQQARLVLGDTDDANCTYPLGYVKRQPLYACLTCRSSSEPGGVCLACSLHCHRGHDLVEMYTKRRFRCDCGNSRFPDDKCQLAPEKMPTNADNAYNHNFRGLYCVCERPYPDPRRGDDEEDMLQCALCEDWFHVSHLDAAVPSEEEGRELVCAGCVEEHQFLEHYVETPVDLGSKAEDEEEEEEEEEGICRTERCTGKPNVEEHQFLNHHKVTPVDFGSKAEDEEEEEEEEEGICRMERRTGKMNAEEHQLLSHHKVTPVDLGSKPEEGVCRMEIRKGRHHILKGSNEETPVACEDQQGQVSGRCRSVFLPDGWRTSLCRCDKCLARYRREGVAYLLDPEDTMRWYEERGARRGEGTSRHNMAMECLAGMDRAVSAQAVQEYNEMQERLKEYLKKFAENGKVVREEDIKEFFEGLANKKRRRLE